MQLQYCERELAMQTANCSIWICTTPSLLVASYLSNSASKQLVSSENNSKSIGGKLMLINLKSNHVILSKDNLSRSGTHPKYIDQIQLCIPPGYTRGHKKNLQRIQISSPKTVIGRQSNIDPVVNLSSVSLSVVSNTVSTDPTTPNNLQSSSGLSGI